MKRTQTFVSTSLLGGLIVILPIAILVLVGRWLFGLVRSWVGPLTEWVFGRVALPALVEDGLVVLLLLLACFLVGVVVRTRIGRFVHNNLEGRLLSIAPGYSLVKETVMQFLGRKATPFTKVALVQVFESEVRMTAFVTDEHPDGRYTVFVPTGPNPTSGNIYHLRPERVQLIDAPIETALRTVISCGAGSYQLMA